MILIRRKMQMKAAVTSSTFGMLVLAAACASSGPRGPEAADPPSGTVYEAWVTSEAVDEIAKVRFDGDELTVIERHPVGSIPVEVEGPHGVAMSPDGRYAYVTLAHGKPNGSLLKIDTQSRRLAGRAELGLFPATVSVTPDGDYAFVSNFNLHGDPVPSSISMVDLETMLEVVRTETCVMPHGSRINPQGTRHYSVCMMDQLLVEIDAATGEVLRRFSVVPGAEGPVGEVTRGVHPDAAIICSPTWAEPSADGSSVFVTCNRNQEVLELDVDGWRVIRRFDTGENPYNLGVTPDGSYLLVTLRNASAGAVEIHELRTGSRVERIPTRTTHSHGIAVTPDSRYAFVTSEGVGSEPGQIEVIDLRRRMSVAAVGVGQQAAGVAVVPSH